MAPVLEMALMAQCEFGIENPKYCGHCEACWNEETEKEKATQEAAE